MDTPSEMRSVDRGVTRAGDPLGENSNGDVTPWIYEVETGVQSRLPLPYQAYHTPDPDLNP